MKRRGRPPYPDVLTPRQQEVLELLRDRRTNAEIARELGISHDGAKWHVSEIITRLGVTSRDEAAEWQREGERAGTPAAMLAGRMPRLHRRTRRPLHQCSSFQLSVASRNGSTAAIPVVRRTERKPR